MKGKINDNSWDLDTCNFWCKGTLFDPACILGTCADKDCTYCIGDTIKCYDIAPITSNYLVD